MKIQKYALCLQEVPVDLFADPDGTWSYEELVAAAGLDPDLKPPPIVAALAEPWCGHPDGAAVIASAGDGESTITVIECAAAAVAA